MFDHLYYMIDVPMNFVDGLIENDKSEVASVVCVVAPVYNSLAYKCPLVLGQYLRSVPPTMYLSYRVAMITSS